MVFSTGYLPTQKNRAVASATARFCSFYKMIIEHAEDTELFDWMRRYISSNTVKSCEDDGVFKERLKVIIYIWLVLIFKYADT